MQRYRCQIYSNANGWFTSKLVCKRLRYYFGMNTSAKLLLLDDFGAHKTDEVVRLARSLNVHLMFIPPGLTPVCQPADISWIKPLKSGIRLCWTRKLLEESGVGRPFLQLKAPSREQVVSWITENWNYLNEETIKNGFGFKNYLQVNNPLDEMTQSEADLSSSINQLFARADESILRRLMSTNLTKLTSLNLMMVTLKMTLLSLRTAKLALTIVKSNISK